MTNLIFLILKTSQQADAFSEKILALLNEAKQTVRAWSTQTLKGRLLNRGYVTCANFTTEIEVSRTNVHTS